MPSSTEENYLKAIHRRSRDKGAENGVSLGLIAQDLSVTPGTVTTMMKQLAERNLVRYRSRRGVVLTPEGHKTALEIIRRHRLIELFLVEVLKMDWSEVHREAEVLEHVVSDKLIQRINDMLGNPASDPHGAPIPDASGAVAKMAAVSLSDCPPGLYRVVQVEDNTPEFLGWLSEHGLVPGAQFRIQKIDPPAGILTLECPAKHEAVSASIQAVSRILVASADE
ncbi:MAG: hypothetical protein B0D92_01540 [Spirochaeta sp. LUC14_002_19_P3]|nr:MAG: hypothetical protein B0D92_01540 [Spirochaeta sp. LUC14_002_19_P3]